MSKLDYISRLLQRTSKKRIESYVIGRIWHLLDDYNIKMVPQQYVTRTSIKYALTDVYFPQIGFHVEVNEKAHYDSDENIQRDLNRIEEIKRNTSHKVFVIDCRENLKGIHQQIDHVVTAINEAVSLQKESGTFVNWQPENEYNPNYWKEKGTISIQDEVSLRTIEDIAQLFDIEPNKTKRGFLRIPSIEHPKFSNYLLWWPAEKKRSGWVNTYDEVKATITETHTNPEKKANHYHEFSNKENTRIVFFHYKDILGVNNYKFVGIFKNDNNLSNENIGTVWVRVGEQLNLKSGEYSKLKTEEVLIHN